MMDALQRAQPPGCLPPGPCFGNGGGGKAALDSGSHKATCGPGAQAILQGWETAWSPGKGTQPASGTPMQVQALPLVGWVAWVAEIPPGSVSPSRLSNISLCLTSRLKVGLGLSILEIKMWGHLPGL